MSEDLRIVVLGAGMMGAFHVDALSKRIRGAQVTVINDFFADKAAEVADKIGGRVVDDPIEASARHMCSAPTTWTRPTAPASSSRLTRRLR
jgi:threonine dehydrogenase-like Zn-dependent dehydrogenase